jgi:two-component system, chemotaxis family, protein-glutamate methylesterase/glutaminase
MACAIVRQVDGRSSAIFVIGVSAGGMDALIRLVSQLPGDFPAPVFVVCHMSADTTGVALIEALAKHGKIPCSHAKDREPFRRRHISRCFVRLRSPTGIEWSVCC